VRCLQLTPQGEKMMERHDKSRTKNVLTVLNYLTPKVRKEVLTALDALMEATHSVNQEKSSNGKTLSGPHQKPADLLISKEKQ